jgi:MraZ protein
VDANARRAEPSESSCCFTSSFARSVDGNGRFNLPFRLRRTSGGDSRFVATEGPNGVLCLMTAQEWARAFDRIRSKGLTKELRDELRLKSLSSHFTQPDKQGRISIPPQMLARYGIKDKLMLVGMGHFIELWSPERLEEYRAGKPTTGADFNDDFFA